MTARPSVPPDAGEATVPVDHDLRGAPLAAGRYRLKRVIARGGMGMVYLAEHVNLRRSVALKVLTPPPGADDDGSFQRRFQLEAETLAALDHPNIVTLHDYGQLEDGRYFLAMEFIDGPRFTDIVRDGPLPPDRALRLLLQVCTALRYAHRRNLVHRDLKPSNLLIRLDDEGQEHVKVVDFGLVKVAEADQSLTKAGHVLGSPHCMAPEQVNGGDVDTRADIYAIGVLLFRSITGVYPFHGATAAATMIAHIKEPIPTLQSVAPDLAAPASLEPIIRRCLAKNPDDRYQMIDELIREMAAASNVPADQFQSVSLSHLSFPNLPVEQAAPPPPRSRTGLWVALGLGVLALLGVMIVALFFLLRPTAPEAPAVALPAPEASAPAAPAATPPAAPAAPETPPAAPATTPAATAPPAATTPATAPPKKKKSTTPTEPKKEKAPDGYLGLPEDFQ